MKTICLLSCLAVQGVHAQEHHLWIGLTRNRVFPDALLRAVQETSVTMEVGQRLSEVRLADIEQVRVIKIETITRGAITGGGAGLVLGGAAGLLGSPRENRNVKIGTTALAGAVLGAIIGTILENAPTEEEIIDLRGKTAEEKRKVFQEIFTRRTEETMDDF